MGEAARARAGADFPPWLDDRAQALDALMRHPGFGRAVARVTAGMTGIYSGNLLLNRILNDRGRVVFALLVLYLDALPPEAGGGLTVARLQALCVGTGLCSRGRARALAALMRWGGYLAPSAQVGDRRLKPLEPQEKLRALQRRRWEVMLGALGELDPAPARLVPHLGDPAVTRALIRGIGDAYCAGYRVIADAPELSGLLDRDGALMILLTLRGAVESGQPAPAIAALARRFHVSRAHVLELLRDGEACGLVLRDGPGAGTLSPAGRAALDRLLASAFHVVAASARAAERHVAAS